MNLLVLPGDGIGPEITAATLDVLRAVSGGSICGCKSRRPRSVMQACAIMGARFTLTLSRRRVEPTVLY